MGTLSLLLFSLIASGADLKIEVVNTNDVREAVDDAVIFAVPALGPAALKAQEYKIVQRNKKFEPRVLVIEQGSKVSFPNEDPFSHSVYAISEAKSFELPLFKRSDPVPAPILFDKTGKVVVGCNIHDYMVAYIVVTNSYFAKSVGGKADLKLTPGKYRLEAWHPRLHEKENVIVNADYTLSGDGIMKVTLALKPRPKPASNDSVY